MVVDVQWDGSDRFVAGNSFGCTTSIAGTGDAQAAGKYPSALDLFVSSLGGCPCHEILDAMNEKGRRIEYLAVKVEGIRRDAPPTTFERMHVTFTLAGDIDDSLARETINDVMTRRCPVAVMFARATDLTWEHRIVPEPPR
jgi:putative redox protein